MCGCRFQRTVSSGRSQSYTEVAAQDIVVGKVKEIGTRCLVFNNRSKIKTSNVGILWHWILAVP